MTVPALLLTQCAHAIVLYSLFSKDLIFKMVVWMQINDMCKELSIVPGHNKCPICYWWETFLSSTYNTSDTKCVCVFFSPHPPILQLSQYQVGVRQFSYDTNYPQLAQTLQVKGSISYDYLQLQMPVVRLSKVVTCTSDKLAINQGFP